MCGHVDTAIRFKTESDRLDDDINCYARVICLKIPIKLFDKESKTFGCLLLLPINPSPLVDVLASSLFRV